MAEAPPLPQRVVSHPEMPAPAPCSLYIMSAVRACCTFVPASRAVCLPLWAMSVLCGAVRSDAPFWSSLMCTLTVLIVSSHAQSG